MNPLLQQIDTLERQATWPADRQSRRALRLLEWSRVTDQVAGYCLNRAAAVRIRRRRPWRGREAIEIWWRLADELRPSGEAGRWPPLLDVSFGLAVLDRARPLQLDGEELRHLAGIAEGLDGLRDYFCRARAALPMWGEAAAELDAFGATAAAIKRVLDREGRLRDSASPLLGRLRRTVSRQEQAVRREIERAMDQARRQGWTTASEVTLRGDRFCLPVRSGARRRVDGIVHDRSASGNTLFVEPAPVVHLHNELVELRFELASEERRLLQELNRAVEEVAPALQEAVRFLLLVDEVRAGLLWSREFACRRPRLDPEGRLRVCQGRHPLLVQYGPGGLSESAATVPAGSDAGADLTAAGASPAPSAEVVPLDLEIPAGKRIVLVSGPNAGGKSVCLKTVGVLILLAQSGWDVPAREDTVLPLLQQLFVDLGDEQSIEKSLSSFSAHLGHMVDFLGRADRRTLILCDEIGGGTDPQEGTALAFAVLEELSARGSVVLASTHFGLLKAAVHDHPAMVNAAMDYDEDSLRPLFTLRMGVPGASHAFDIAARWGFPSAALQRARQMVGEERFQIERLLTELGSRARELAALEESSRRSAEQVADLERELDRRLEQFDREREQLRQQIRHEGESMLRQGRQAIERSVRDIRSSGGDKGVIRRAKKDLQQLAGKLPEPPERSVTPVELRVGQRILIPHLGLAGQVVEVRGDKVIADAQGMRLNLSRDAVEVTVDGTGAERPSPDRQPADSGWRWRQGPPEIQHQIDLRGMRGEEAWLKLDLLIDRSIPAGLRQLSVIHGVGTGRLRQYLHEQLACDGRVSRFTEAPLDRGGHGVTVVHLSES